MGAWGTAVFSDDTACDVRNDYRTYVGDGLSGPDATDRVLTEWSDTLSDPDEGSVFWRGKYKPSLSARCSRQARRSVISVRSFALIASMRFWHSLRMVSGVVASLVSRRISWRK